MTGPAGSEKKLVLKPRDAASLLILDTSDGPPRVLFGKRHATQVFAPGKYVYPGGAFEPEDAETSFGEDLPESEIAPLMIDMKGRTSEARARGLALTAIREAFEETGLIIGRPAAAETQLTGGPVWSPFLAHGAAPALSEMRLLARAITPPGRPRRFDTRFFVVPATAITQRVPLTDGEFTELVWANFEEAKTLDLHSMTRAILDDLTQRLNDQHAIMPGAGIPYYFSDRGTFRRDLIKDGVRQKG